MPHFGKRIVGEATWNQQKAAERGGSNFGSRVRDGAVPIAKPPIKPRLTQSRNPSEPETPLDDGISVEELAKTLAANATFVETLYMQELARPEGPRAEALGHIHRAAASLRKYDITREIDELRQASEATTGTVATPPASTSTATPPGTPPTKDELAALSYDDLVAYAKAHGKPGARRGQSRDLLIAGIVEQRGGDA